MTLRGCFVTGTDTGAGKTVLTAALCAAMRASGVSVAAFKPVATGIGEAPEGDWPHDHELLARVTGARPADVCARTFDPPLSPHLAAQLADTRLDPEVLLAAARAAAEPAEVLVVEGVGGLLAPLSLEHSVRDLAVMLGLPLVVAARPGLGTISHTLLTLEAARAAALDVRAVVLTPWPREPELIHRSNRETIAELGAVEVAMLAQVACDVGQLARAGAALPWRDWLGGA